MKQKSPAFQFYANDFLAGRVATYNLDEIGAYSLLLAFDWSLNGLPTESEKLAKLCRISHRKFQKIWETIGEQFPERDGRRHNPRLDLERAKQEENRRKKQEAALSRWSADADADASILHEEKTCPPSPTPSPTPKTTTPDGDAVFQEAWAVYPKRPGNSRADSYKQWLKRVKDGVDPLDMLEGTRRYAKYVEAEQKDPTYVKMAQTFYGPGRHFDSDWTPAPPNDPLLARIALLCDEEDAALAKTAKMLESRGVA